MHFAKCSFLRDKHSTKAKSLFFLPLLYYTFNNPEEKIFTQRDLPIVYKARKCTAIYLTFRILEN